MTATEDAYTIAYLITLFSLPFSLSIAIELNTALLTNPTSLIIMQSLLTKTIPLLLINLLSCSIIALGTWIDSLDFL